MQSTGQTSTQAVSFVPMHGSVMMYAKTRSSSSPASLNLHAAGKSIRIAVIVRDAGLRVAPAVVTFAIVEIDEPQTFRLCAKRLELVGPAVDHLAQGGR